MLPPGAIFELKIHQNAFAAGASPRTPLESLQRSTDPLAPLAGFQGPLRRKRGEGRGRNGRVERE